MRFVIDWISALIVFLTFALWAGPNAGAWFGRVLPAAEPMTLTSAVVEDGNVIFGGQSARLLSWCSPRELRWRLGVRGSQNVPVTVTWGPPQVRANGVFTFEGWVAEMDSVEAFKYGTYGDVLHRCYILGTPLPFLVRSRFWN